jgi:O-acetyl-ADP-ribose deacetylase (regulator of RNase III)
MALHILKEAVSWKELSKRYRRYARVTSVRNTGLKRLFGPKAGTVKILRPEGLSYPVFQVVPPAWKGGQGDAWETLQQCYQRVLQMAADRHCEAIAVPLLTAEGSDFPADIDYKIAVDTIREFLKDQSLDVYLMVSRQNGVAASKLRRDVENFLSRNYLEWELPWSSSPFGSQTDRFDTLAPSFSLRSEEREEPDESLDKAIQDWLADQETVFPESCGKEPAPQASFRDEVPRKAKRAEQSTGRLPNLDRYLRDLDAGFSETLLKLIDRSGKKDSEIYNKANVSRQHFSKIRNNPDYKPTKATAIAFAIALELNMDETNDLIGRAGYTLTRSSKFDVIIMYFIQSRNYNMFDINETLYEFDQSLLGA